MTSMLETTLGELSRNYIKSEENIKICKQRFTHSSIHCLYRHPTALYSNCLHSKADTDMPNCLIDECPLKNE